LPADDVGADRERVGLAVHVGERASHGWIEVLLGDLDPVDIQRELPGLNVTDEDVVVERAVGE
jgi:hypothetical protein